MWKRKLKSFINSLTDSSSRYRMFIHYVIFILPNIFAENMSNGLQNLLISQNYLKGRQVVKMEQRKHPILYLDGVLHPLSSKSKITTLRYKFFLEIFQYI